MPSLLSISVASPWQVGGAGTGADLLSACLSRCEAGGRPIARFWACPGPRATSGGLAGRENPLAGPGQDPGGGAPAGVAGLPRRASRAPAEAASGRFSSYLGLRTQARGLPRGSARLWSPG